MGIRVAKFGGSSLANGQQFKKVTAIIRANEDRRYVVPSAPGKAPGLEEKVTDMLYGCQAAFAEGDREKAENLFAQMGARYTAIVEELGSGYALQPHLDRVWQCLADGADSDYAASRGEYLNGLILADYLGYAFVDPAEGIRFDENGEFDPRATQALLGALLQKTERAVVPGFYGAYADGRIKTFSRGGSDITGAIVAWVVQADVYENWTDVPGFLIADPRIVPEAKTIAHITYQELRELSYMGASVLHEDSIFPVSQCGIPVQVRNTNDPGHPGTLIKAQTPEESDCLITGIAGHKGFTVFHIEKDQMNKLLGFGRRVLAIFERHGVPFEHLPTGIDTMSVVVQDAMLQGRAHDILRDIQDELQPDVLDVHGNLALIATVGHSMISRVGISARLFTALGDAGVNVRMIDQGSSELNIIVGVDSGDFEVAVKAVYAAFVGA